MKNLFESWRNFVNEQQYVIQPGDNITNIAKSNNLTLQQLLDLNPQYKRNPNLIKVGQKIKLSQEDEDTSFDPEDILSELEYEVQELFANYYSSGGGFKNNLRDCVVFSQLLNQDQLVGAIPFSQTLFEYCQIQISDNQLHNIWFDLKYSIDKLSHKCFVQVLRNF